MESILSSVSLESPTNSSPGGLYTPPHCTGRSVTESSHDESRLLSIHFKAVQRWHKRDLGLQSSSWLSASPVCIWYPASSVCKVYNNYVADSGNHRIQVLNSNLSYASSFCRKCSNNGEFNYPYSISTDKEGNVYVADWNNHRIQVYLRQFGKEEEGLKFPVSISCNVVDI